MSPDWLFVNLQVLSLWITICVPSFLICKLSSAFTVDKYVSPDWLFVNFQVLSLWITMFPQTVKFVSNTLTEAVVTFKRKRVGQADLFE